LVGVPGKEEENYLPLIFFNNERQLFPAGQFPSQQELITSLGHAAQSHSSVATCILIVVSDAVLDFK